MPNANNQENNTITNNPQVNNPQQAVTTIQVQSQYQGIIPPPAMLQGYENIIPGGAERILKMAEEQHAHRIKMEDKVIKSDTRNSFLGVIFAFLIALIVLFIAFYAIKKDKPITGAFLSTIGLGSLVGTFIYGTKSRRNERESKENK